MILLAMTFLSSVRQLTPHDDLFIRLLCRFESSLQIFLKKEIG